MLLMFKQSSKTIARTPQGCFMIVAEGVHPQLRLAYPNGAKIMAGLAAWIVNRFMEATTIEEGLMDLFGEVREEGGKLKSRC